VLLARCLDRVDVADIAFIPLTREPATLEIQLTRPTLMIDSTTLRQRYGPRAGDLSAVYVPGIEDEAFRDLARAWAAAREDLRHARQRLKSLLLAHGVRYTGSANWGEAHRRWPGRCSVASAWQHLAFDEHRRTILTDSRS